MKYIIYARRSSEDKKKQVQSIPDQLAWAEMVAKERGLEIAATFQDVKTGTKPGREQFSQMIEMINKTREPLGIICWKMDRLARNPVDEGSLKYAFMQNKITHILAKDREFREGENQILMGVEFGAATQYSIELGRNVKRGMASKVAKGWKPNLAPPGYLNKNTGGKGEATIVPDPERFESIQKMWQRLLTGAYTVPEISKTATHRWGLLDKRGKPFPLSTLYALFNNPFYAGQFYWHGELQDGSHQPMITPEEFDRAQVILGRKGKPRMRKHEHTYTGLIRCGECGCMITAEPPKRKVNKGNGKVHIYHYLRCSKKNKEIKCSQKYLQVPDLEKQIDETLASIEISPAFFEWAVRQLKAEHKTECGNFAAERRKIQASISENENMSEQLLDKLLKGVINDETYEAGKKRFEQQRKSLQSELAKYDGNKDDYLEHVEHVFDFASRARAAFATGSREDKRRIFAALGSNLVIKDCKVHVELRKPFQYLQVAVKNEERVLRPLEPRARALNQLKKPVLDKLVPVWLARRRFSSNHLGIQPSPSSPHFYRKLANYVER